MSDNYLTFFFAILLSYQQNGRQHWIRLQKAGCCRFHDDKHLI